MQEHYITRKMFNRARTKSRSRIESGGIYDTKEALMNHQRKMSTEGLMHVPVNWLLPVFLVCSSNGTRSSAKTECSIFELMG